jgi:hypothetical protein
MKLLPLNLFFLIINISLSCTGPDQATNLALEESLKLAGQNRDELLKVIDHYQAQNDSLKLKAAYYLIEHMPGHGTVTYSWIDADGVEAKTDILNYASLAAFNDAMDSLGYNQIVSPKLEDCQTIKASYLIDNIDRAFAAWQNNPWADKISFDQFCEFILPYRIGTEKLENWRESIVKQFSGKMDSLTRDVNLFENPELINKLVSSIGYRYDVRGGGLSEYQCYSEMTNFKIGTCEDQAALLVFLGRAFGIPLTLDAIPIWGGGGFNGGHARISVVDGPTQGRLLKIDENILVRDIVAHAFRTTYAKQKNTPASLIKNLRDIPPFLRDPRCISATSTHSTTQDVTFKSAGIPQGEEIVYICANHIGDEWEAVSWALKAGSNEWTFKDMGTNVLYRVATYHNGEYAFLSEVFLLRENGELHYFNPDFKNTNTIELHPDWQGVIGELHIKDALNIYYWDNGWKFLSQHDEPKGNVIKFRGIPSNSLCRIANHNATKSSRMLMVEDGNVRWL